MHLVAKLFYVVINANGYDEIVSSVLVGAAPLTFGIRFVLSSSSAVFIDRLFYTRVKDSEKICFLECIKAGLYVCGPKSSNRR